MKKSELVVLLVEVILDVVVEVFGSGIYWLLIINSVGEVIGILS